MTSDMLTGKILVVDDEEQIRNVVCRALKAKGYDAVGAADGPDALLKSACGEFHLMLLDLKMPEMNGVEVLQRITIDHPNMSTIVLTGVADSEEIIGAAMAEGAFAVLAKPCLLEEIVDTVNKAFERKFQTIA